jgi:NitT/TauT family transport system ATP-binding protein
VQRLRSERRGEEPQGHPSRPAIVFDRVDLDLGGRRIIEQLSFSVPRGQFVCVVGPSGCGKTTLLRMVTGLVAPTSGSVRREGVAVAAPSREVAVVFQDYGKALLPWRTAAGNVALALEAMGMPKRLRAPRVAELLSKFGLAAHAEKYPAQLSGGMQQRLQIARCLAQEPSILLMDEPFGALDAITRHGLQDEVAALVAATGVTVMFVTHDLEEAIYLGDRVISLRANPGRLAQDIDVPLVRPRDQLSTRENAEFLRLRHLLFGFIQEMLQ